MDLALTLCHFHPCWMSVSCGGRCGVSSSKSGIDDTNFQRWEAWLCRTPICTDLKWDIIFTHFLDIVVYFRLAHAVFHLFRPVKMCQEGLCFQESCLCKRHASRSVFRTSDNSRKLSLHSTIWWAYMLVCHGHLHLSLGMWHIAPTQWGDMAQTNLS